MNPTRSRRSRVSSGLRLPPRSSPAMRTSPAVGAVETRGDMQQSALSRAGRTHHGGEGSSCERGRDPAESVDAFCPRPYVFDTSTTWTAGRCTSRSGGLVSWTVMGCLSGRAGPRSMPGFPPPSADQRPASSGLRPYPDRSPGLVLETIAALVPATDAGGGRPGSSVAAHERRTSPPPAASDARAGHRPPPDRPGDVARRRMRRRGRCRLQPLRSRSSGDLTAETDSRVHRGGRRDVRH